VARTRALRDAAHDLAGAAANFRRFEGAKGDIGQGEAKHPHEIARMMEFAQVTMPQSQY
jgi:hypothetical protein